MGFAGGVLITLFFVAIACFFIALYCAIKVYRCGAIVSVVVGRGPGRFGGCHGHSRLG